jgi:hypothetical protein
MSKILKTARQIIGWGFLALIVVPLLIVHWIAIVSILLCVFGVLLFVEESPKSG